MGTSRKMAMSERPGRPLTLLRMLSYSRDCILRVSVHRVEALAAEMGMRKDGLIYIYILEDGIFELAGGDLVYTSPIEVVEMDLRDVVLRALFDFGP